MAQKYSVQPGRQVPTPPRRRKGAGAAPPVAPTPTPAQARESDAPVNTTPLTPDPVMVQAKRDLDAGLVDTDKQVMQAGRTAGVGRPI